MRRVLIYCPETRRPINTLVAVEKGLVELEPRKTRGVGPCPHCGRVHVWTPDQAFLESAPAA